MYLFLALLSAIFAALVAIFGKLGLKNIDATLGSTIRAIIMAIFLFLVSAFFKKFDDFSFHSLTSKDWIFIILAGLSGALSWLFYFLALKLGPVTEVAVVDRMSLIFVIIFSSLVLGEVFNFKIAAGIILIFLGSLLIVLK